MGEGQTGLLKSVVTANQGAEKIPPMSLIPTREQITAVYQRDGLLPDVIKDLTPGADNEKAILLAKLAILKVFEHFHEDPTGFGVAVLKGGITVMDEQDQPLYKIAEHYFERFPAAGVASTSFLNDATIKYQLEKRYGIPYLASPDFIIGYLAAHSTVHHIQLIQNRLGNVNEKIHNIETDTGAINSYMEIPEEKEAHEVGLEVMKVIWKEVFSST